MKISPATRRFVFGVLAVVSASMAIAIGADATTPTKSMPAVKAGALPVVVINPDGSTQVDANGNVNINLNTALDGGTDSVSMRINNIPPGMVIGSPAGTEWGIVTRNVPMGATTVNANGASGAAVTLTIPAVASQFHYISSIQIQEYTTAARTGGATPVTCTTTNLGGTPPVEFETAQAVGTDVDRFVIQPSSMPVKSSVVNTNTTVVCPATTSIIWNITAVYFAAP